jgi:hypothetical protein
MSYRKVINQLDLGLLVDRVYTTGNLVSPGNSRCILSFQSTHQELSGISQTNFCNLVQKVLRQHLHVLEDCLLLFNPPTLWSGTVVPGGRIDVLKETGSDDTLEVVYEEVIETISFVPEFSDAFPPSDVKVELIELTNDMLSRSVFFFDTES